MKFNQEQLIQYLNMEARYREIEAKVLELLATESVRDDEEEFTRVCRSYAHAVIEITKLRAWVRGAQGA
jgi:hypothetical protein